MSNLDRRLTAPEIAWAAAAALGVPLEAYTRALVHAVEVYK